MPMLLPKCTKITLMVFWNLFQILISQEWKNIRRKIIIRDNGCDLGLDGYEIRGKILIHHMNPIKQQDILLRTDLVLNPEYLIATTLSTHNAIHYGDAKLLLTVPNERRKNDTCPWRH